MLLQNPSGKGYSSLVLETVSSRSVAGERERLESVSDFDNRISSVSDPWVLIAGATSPFLAADECLSSDDRRLTRACSPAAGSKIKFHMTNGHDGCEGNVS